MNYQIKGWKRSILLFLLAVVLFAVYWLNVKWGTYIFLRDNSESLVTGTIYNTYVSGPKSSLKPYGLGWYVSYNVSTAELLTNEEYTDGFCQSDTWIAVAMNDVTQREYQVGYQIVFLHGQICSIQEVVYDEPYIYIRYDSQDILTVETAGTIEYLKVVDEYGRVQYGGIRTDYTSSFGLQGIVFAIVGKLVPIVSAVDIVKMLCTMLMVLTSMAICVLMKKKYNGFMAGVFYVTFLTSPIVIAFASNMYWLEGLLYISLAIGAWISLDCRKRWRRMTAYAASFFFVLVKCLCGYEYITTVMLSLICFLLADGLAAVCRKESRQDGAIIFRTIFGIGICALLGFASALCLHAYLRGSGNIGAGLRDIYENDVLRRTLGGNPDNFDASYTESLSASIPSVLLKYFDFSNSTFATHIFVGISGTIFPVLCVGSGILSLLGKKLHVLEVRECILYFVLFCSCISWFILGKSHSAAHTFLNFILWYFGYIQMILYVIVKYVCAGFAYMRRKKSLPERHGDEQ